MKPMPLTEYKKYLLKLAKSGQWELFKLTVKKRSEWFKQNNLKDDN